MKELANVRQQLANAQRNAALAESRELFQDISRIYEDLKAREAQLTLLLADNNHTESDLLAKVKTKSVPGKKAKSLGKDHHAGA